MSKSPPRFEAKAILPLAAGARVGVGKAVGAGRGVSDGGDVNAAGKVGLGVDVGSVVSAMGREVGKVSKPCGLGGENE